MRRFWLHIMLTFGLYYPILARLVAGLIGGFSAAAYFPFKMLMPAGTGELFIEQHSLMCVTFVLLSIWDIALGSLSMEIHSVSRKLVSFPLFLLNLLSAMIYFFSAV